MGLNTTVASLYLPTNANTVDKSKKGGGNMNYKVCLLLLVIFVSGCATQGINTSEYTPPQSIKVNNEIELQTPQPQVWDILVKELSKSFYVINNIDKESRIINVSFSSNSPAEYLDCGKTYRTYVQGDKKEVYHYDTANSSQFKFATSLQQHKSFAYYINARRETMLDGRSNIYVAPSEKEKNNTVVTVNTRYILNFKMKGDGITENIHGNIVSSQRLPEETFTIMLNTNQRGQHELKEGTIYCYSKGKLEKDILDMVRGGSK